MYNEDIEFNDVAELSEGVRVQLITGIDTIGLPPGGLKSQTIVKNSDLAEDASWQYLKTIAKIKLNQTINAENNYEMLIPNNYFILFVINDKNEQVTYTTIQTDSGTLICSEEKIIGYAIVVNITNLEDVVL